MSMTKMLLRPGESQRLTAVVTVMKFLSRHSRAILQYRDTQELASAGAQDHGEEELHTTRSIQRGSVAARYRRILRQ
jgi:hypothetical protein